MSSEPSDTYAQVCAWDNLLSAYRKAASGKRGGSVVSAFERGVADRLIALQDDLTTGDYVPGEYTHFVVHDPKVRLISAAPFRDRIVHHALCNVVEPRFERGFIEDSYANRVGKGTHRAVDRLQQFARHFRYVLRLDIVQHFPALDHQVLLAILARRIPEADVMALVAQIVASGGGIHDDGDSGRGLPIGNLTSQFWSNCYLDPLDHFIKRELRCKGYVRYVDDMALFADCKAQLWAWKRAVLDRLVALRLGVHENAAQALPVTCGIPWLGFVVYPDHRRLKARNAVKFTRRLRARWADYCAGRCTFAEFDASVQGWVNHVRYADTWGLREHVLGQAFVRPARCGDNGGAASRMIE